MSSYYLETLIEYYSRTRGIGHTRLMIEGLEHYQGEAILIGHTRDYAEQIARRAMHSNPNIRIAPRTLSSLHTLRGHSGPLAYDNAALIDLFRDCLQEINKLQRENAELEKWKRLTEARGAIEPMYQDPRAPDPFAQAFHASELLCGFDRFPEVDDDGFHKCEKPDCDRRVPTGTAYCCHGCTLAAEGNYEIHESGILGHSDACNARHEERSGPEASIGYRNQVFVEITRTGKIKDEKALEIIKRQRKLLAKCESRKYGPFSASRTIIDADNSQKAAMKRSGKED